MGWERICREVRGGVPQLPTSSLALRHLRPWPRVDLGLARFPPGSTGQLVLQGVQVPPADCPGLRPQALPNVGLLPWFCRRGKAVPGEVTFRLQFGDFDCCSWSPEMNRTDLRVSCLQSRKKTSTSLVKDLGVINAHHRCEEAPECLALRRSLLSKTSTSFPTSSWRELQFSK